MNRFFGNLIEQGFDMRLPSPIGHRSDQAMDQRPCVDRCRARRIDGAEHEIDLCIGVARVPEGIAKLLAPTLDVFGRGRRHLDFNPLDIAQLPLTLAISRHAGDSGRVGHRILQASLQHNLA